MTVLYNPTKEDLEGRYVGELTTIPAGGKVKVEDKRGRHLLTHLGPRGLVSLDYGDEGEGERRKAEIGRRERRRFIEKQVVNFNQENEKREQQKQSYLTPSEQIETWAEELGIKLIRPYRPESQVDERIGALNKELEDKKEALEAKDKEVDELKNTVSKLSEQMQNFMDMMSGAKTVEESSAGVKKKIADAKDETDKITDKVKADNAERVKELRKKYASQSAKTFMNWVYNNLVEILEQYPEENQTEIGKKWAKHYGTPFPTEVPEDFKKAG